MDRPAGEGALAGGDKVGIEPGRGFALPPADVFRVQPEHLQERRIGFFQGEVEQPAVVAPDPVYQGETFGDPLEQRPIAGLPLAEPQQVVMAPTQQQAQSCADRADEGGGGDEQQQVDGDRRHRDEQSPRVVEHRPADQSAQHQRQRGRGLAADQRRAQDRWIVEAEDGEAWQQGAQLDAHRGGQQDEGDAAQRAAHLPRRGDKSGESGVRVARHAAPCRCSAGSVSPVRYRWRIASGPPWLGLGLDMSNERAVALGRGCFSARGAQFPLSIIVRLDCPSAWRVTAKEWSGGEVETSGARA